MLKNLFKFSKRAISGILSLLLLFTVILFTSCEQDNECRKIVIWTSCSEFAQYTELFNKTHKENNAVIVYKENPAASLPPEKDEQVPDIIVGSWLRTDNIQDDFKSLDYFFDNQILESDVFYSQMFESGKLGRTQYLLPVSFNLPAIIFAAENKDLVPDSYTLTLEEIREIAGEFNEKNRKDAYTKIGFTPLSNENFLYLATKLKGVNFREVNGEIVWDFFKLEETAELLKDWVITENTSAQTEEDFTFKYLFMPNYRQVTSGRTLFAYTTSDELLKIMKDQNLDIDYRWISENDKVPMEDPYAMMGIYKYCENQVGATEFMTWFFNKENQKAILERKENCKLDTEIFGISGGFSSLKEVTEYILPIYYKQLLTNIPPAQMLTVPQQLPPTWESYKKYVVETYLRNYIHAEEEPIPTIPDLKKEWQKKVFN